MNAALFAFAVSLFTQAFPDSDATRWEVDSVRSVCPIDEACTTWVEGSYPLLDTGPERPRVRYKCAEVQGYLATCYEWGPSDHGWVLLFD